MAVAEQVVLQRLSRQEVIPVALQGVAEVAAVAVARAEPAPNRAAPLSPWFCLPLPWPRQDLQPPMPSYRDPGDRVAREVPEHRAEPAVPAGMDTTDGRVFSR